MVTTTILRDENKEWEYCSLMSREFRTGNDTQPYRDIILSWWKKKFNQYIPLGSSTLYMIFDKDASLAFGMWVSAIRLVTQLLDQLGSNSLSK